MQTMPWTGMGVFIRELPEVMQDKQGACVMGKNANSWRGGALEGVQDKQDGCTCTAAGGI